MKVDVKLGRLSKGHKTLALPAAMLTNPIINLREGLCPALLRCATRGINQLEKFEAAKTASLVCISLT